MQHILMNKQQLKFKVKKEEKMSREDYEVIIGLEVHAELSQNKNILFMPN